MDNFETLFDLLASFFIENIELDSFTCFFGNTVVCLIAKGSLLGMTPQISYCINEEGFKWIILGLFSTF